MDRANPAAIRLAPSGIVNQRRDVSPVRALVASDFASSRVSGGIAGSIYPGSFDLEAVKKKRTKAGQEMKKSIDANSGRWFLFSEKACLAAGNIRTVHGNTASKTIG